MTKTIYLRSNSIVIETKGSSGWSGVRTMKVECRFVFLKYDNSMSQHDYKEL